MMLFGPLLTLVVKLLGREGRTEAGQQVHTRAEVRPTVSV